LYFEYPFCSGLAFDPFSPKPENFGIGFGSPCERQ
jgi:hypothetical protein